MGRLNLNIFLYVLIFPQETQCYGHCLLKPQNTQTRHLYVVNMLTLCIQISAHTPPTRHPINQCTRTHPDTPLPALGAQSPCQVSGRSHLVPMGFSFHCRQPRWAASNPEHPASFAAPTDLRTHLRRCLEEEKGAVVIAIVSEKQSPGL